MASPESEKPAGLPAPWRVRLGWFAGWLAFASLISLILSGIASDTWLVVSSVGGGVAFLLALIAGRFNPLVVCTVIGLVIAIGASGILRACCVSNDAFAIASLRAINSGEAAYSSSCAAGGYAIDLADLVKAPVGGTGFISPDLGHNGVIKRDYIITLARDAAPGVTDLGSAAVSCNGSGNLASSYFASANPVTPGGTGTRYFATDTRGTIFQSLSGPIPNPIPPDTRVIQ